MKQKKLYVVIMAVFVILVTLSGNSMGEDKIPKVILIVGGPVGSMDNMLATAISSVLHKHLATQVEVRAFVGPSGWHPLLDRGEVDFGITNPIDAARAYRGLFEYSKATAGKGFNDRLVALGPEAKLSMMVRADSPFKSVADLKGKRVSWNFGGHIAAKADTEALLANGGLTLDDVKTVPVANINAGVQALIENRVHATMEVLTAGIVKEADVKIGVRFLPVDPSPKAVAKMQEKFPGCYAVDVIPGAPGSGVLKTRQHCLGFRKPLITRSSLNDHTVYLVTKTLYENYKDLWPFHPMLKLWDPGQMASTGATIPYHSGAVKLYMEAGVWTPKLEKMQGKLFKK